VSGEREKAPIVGADSYVCPGKKTPSAFQMTTIFIIPISKRAITGDCPYDVGRIMHFHVGGWEREK